MELSLAIGIMLTTLAALLSGPVLLKCIKKPLNWPPSLLCAGAGVFLALGCPAPSLIVAPLAIIWALFLLRYDVSGELQFARLLEEEKTRRVECEQRYRKIFEGSDNIILLLDTDLRIREANLSVKKHLGKSHASIVNSSLKELIKIDETFRGSADISAMALEEKLSLFRKHKRATEMTFPVEAKDSNINVRCRLEFVSQHKEAAIMATLSPVDMDHLTKYLLSEEQQHAIDNQIITVDEICKRLTRNLIRYTSHSTKNQILLGLREIVLNAMEHGNLEINYDLKTEALEQRHYTTLLRERQSSPKYNKRKIRIRYILAPDHVRYVVQDEGKGFDHSFFAARKHYNNKELLLHGRGIMLSKNIFDVVRYGKKGTEVTLIKRF